MGQDFSTVTPNLTYVFSLGKGRGLVTAFDPESPMPVRVVFESRQNQGVFAYDLNGYESAKDAAPSIYWQEFSAPEFASIPPELTVIPIDTPIQVRQHIKHDWLVQHFAGYAPGGKFKTWEDGRTSKTSTRTTTWEFGQVLE